MKLVNIIKRDVYFDSVSLMLIAKRIRERGGIIDASIMIGTEENLKILETAGLLKDRNVSANDIIIAIKGEDRYVEEVSKEIDNYFKEISEKKLSVKKPESIEEALKLMPDANLVLISVAGRYVYQIGLEALNKNLNLKIFSDNVPIEDEIKLKKIGKEKGLFVLGPDAGTSIINGVPLGFANVVNRGRIGIIGAAGTGIQDASVIISKYGEGISQALGIGSRDLSNEVGGVMAKFCLEELSNDKNTDLILFIAKFSSENVIKDILDFIERKVEKDVVTLFLGIDKKFFKNYKKIIPAYNLFEAGLKAVYVLNKKDEKEVEKILEKKRLDIKESVSKFKKSKKYIRALYSGGTLCEDAIILAEPYLKKIYSNVSKLKELRIDGTEKSKFHTFIDMGSDEFTKGKPHPMIDFETRIRRILKEAEDKNVGVIILDIVLGYNAHPEPASEIVKAIKEARKINSDLEFVVYILGTQNDPQNYSYQRKILEEAKAIVVDSNYEAILAGCEIVL